MDFVCVCVRIPKCGSTSLSHSLQSAFAGRTIFHLPHTIDFEGEVSSFQWLRFRRSQARSLRRHYHTGDIVEACSAIGRRAANGDLITGGHIDFPFVHQHIGRPVKMITLFRDPYDRCRSEYNYCREAYRKKPPISRIDMTLKHRIAGRFSFPDYLDFLLEHAEIYGNLAARYVGWDGHQPLDDHFAQHVFHSGILEDSVGFMQSLARKLGVRVAFAHHNKTALPHVTLSAAERAKVERLYPLDLALFQYQLLRYDDEDVCAEEAGDLDVSVPAWRANLFNQAMRALFADA